MSLALRMFPLILSGCFLIGKEGEEESDDTATSDVSLDLLFVVDNSDSMSEEAEELAFALDNLETLLAGAGVDGWQAGILTTSVYYDDGATPDIDPGEAGTLVGGAMVESIDDLRLELLCGAICWDWNMPSDPDYVCGDPFGGTISEEFLDCACGAGAWQNNCGTGQEQGLEAAYMAMCRGPSSPPASCYDFPESAAVAFESGDEGSNAGVGDADTLIVIFSDEGDGSLRTDDGHTALAGEVDEVVAGYDALLREFDASVRVSVAGPAYVDGNGDCLNGAQNWGVERYQDLAALSGGTYTPLTDIDADCAAFSMDGILETVIDAE